MFLHILPHFLLINMALKYYTASDNYPELLKATIDRVIVYIAELLYPEEYASDPTTALSRVILSDIDSGNDVMVGDSVSFFRNSNGEFPFTAYNIGDFEYDEEKSTRLGSSGLYYCNVSQKYVRAWPMMFDIPMYSFFSKAIDFRRALTMMYAENVNLIRLAVPVLINGSATTFPMDVKFNITKGGYAAALEEYFRINNIWDISHTASVSFMMGMLEDTTVYPIDADKMYLYLSNLDQDGFAINKETHIVPQRTLVSSVDPADEETGVAVDKVIDITFNQPMKESTLVENISIDPLISADFSLSVDGLVASITPVSNMDATTTYTVTINRNVQDYFDGNLETDYEFSFTTA